VNQLAAAGTAIIIFRESEIITL